MRHRALLEAILLGALLTILCQNARSSVLDAEDEFLEGTISAYSPDVYWIYNANTRMNGTGVAVNFHFEKKTKTLIVTNYHVIHDPDDFILIWTFDRKGHPLKRAGKFWAGEKGSDIALLEIRSLMRGGQEDLTGVENKNGALTLPDTNKGLTEEAIGQPSDIKPGRSTVFLGFPLGIGTDILADEQQYEFHTTSGKSFQAPLPAPTQKRPTAKFGRIAYSDEAAGWFLIDAMNNGGNSGSPVFVRTPCGENVCQKLVGIINGYRTEHSPAQVNTSSESAIVSDFSLEIGAGRSLSVLQNSGLAQAVSISRIRDLFNSTIKAERR